ncbi:MAG: DUF1775 domain-containing protein [Acidimicrobiales bacterium]
MDRQGRDHQARHAGEDRRRRDRRGGEPHHLTGGEIGPGEYGDFRIIAGELPDDVDQVEFKAIQTYDDGSETSWIEDPAPEGAEEPEHPAPVLELTSASDGDTSSSSSGAAEDSSSSSSSGAKVTVGVPQDDVDQAKTWRWPGSRSGPSP